MVEGWDSSVLSSAAAFLSERLELTWRSFNGIHSRLSLFQLLLTLPFAAVAWKLHVDREWSFNLRRFAAFLFPRRIYLTRSTAVDVQIFMFGAIFSPARRLLFGLSVGGAAAAFAWSLRALLGDTVIRFGPTTISICALGLLVLLATDFATYIAHRMCHQFKFLWAFHRVHHSAPVLTPLTLIRKHPFFNVFGDLISIAIRAPLLGTILYFWEPGTGASVAAIATILFGIFGSFAGNLRHSQVWLSYGQVVSRVFVSPAMHQIHHSKADAHRDRNFGEVFALWDLAFGTILIPRAHEPLVFGLSDEDDPHGNLFQALFEPFFYLTGTGRIRGRRSRTIDTGSGAPSTAFR